MSESVNDVAHELVRAIADINALTVWWVGADGMPLAAYRSPGPGFVAPIAPSEASARWIEELHPDDREEVRRSWREAFARGEAFESRHRLRQADGPFRWALSRGVPIKVGGHITGWVGTVTDVDEGVRTADELRVSEERLRLALEGNDVGIWDQDLLADRVWVSEQAEVIFRCLGGRMVSAEEFLNFVHPDDRERVQRANAELFSQPQRERVVTRFRLAAADGHSHRWIDGSARAFFDAASRPVRVLGTVRDVTAEQERTQLMLHDAQHDQLTGLPNWTHFAEQADAGLAARYPAVLLLLGLDDHPVLDDLRGTLAGRDLLQRVARRLAAALPAPILLSRIGPEFAVLVPKATAADIGPVETAIRGALSKPFTVLEQIVAVAGNAGIALAPDHGGTAKELLAAADLALHDARRVAPGVTRLYSPRLKQALQERQSLLADMREAIDLGQFELYFQPQLRLADRTIIGAEALLRWRHPRRGLLEPAAFIDELEKSPLALDVGDWIVQTVCRFGAELQARGTALRVAVNLFPIQFKVGDIAATIKDQLEGSGLRPELLEIEITERIVLEHDESIARSLRTLHEHGCSIALDDFGTGYASLSVLKNLPLSRLKIDREFVMGIEHNKGDAVIVDAVVSLARAFGLSLTAEGIETEAQEAIMRQKGCDEGQGYLFGKPMPFGALVAMLA
ncbi:MAG: EAL domain-containing protein [Devosia sp.]|nr:EAL domain-containing protein [Devosia sp.]